MDNKQKLDLSVTEYAEAYGLYETLRFKIERLIIELLEEKKVSYHLVESRTKSVQSFKDKISRPTKSYGDPLKEIPDLCGCRVITYYHDDVETVANIIKDEFIIVEEELSHQQSSIEADRFGYLSAHYVVRIGPTRSKLPEWSAVSEIQAEIQIRTVVQHAWSAVSHALQYKSETRVPSKLQRRLYRIAGLFELADEEFVGIRDQRQALIKDAEVSVESGSKEIPITPSGIKALIPDWYDKNKLSDKLKKAGLPEKEDDNDIDEFVADIIDLSLRAGLNKISEIEKATQLDYQKFLSKLFELELERVGDKARGWAMSKAFLFLLANLYAFIDLLDAEYWSHHGWGDGIALSVQEAIRSTKT